MVFCSHCLLNENVRYLGGAGRRAAVEELVTGYLADGVGIVQMPCPEQYAWGGVLKRRMLYAFGSAGTLRAPVVRRLAGPFVWFTRLAYHRLTGRVARQILDYRRSGMEVVAIVGVGASPSCGVKTTVDLGGAVRSLTHCPMASLDRRFLNRTVVAANVKPGEGLFVEALRHRLSRAAADVPFVEHDLLAEIGA